MIESEGERQERRRRVVEEKTRGRERRDGRGEQESERETLRDRAMTEGQLVGLWRADGVGS